MALDRSFSPGMPIIVRQPGTPGKGDVTTR
jgi:hypothetical protein